MVDSAIKPWHSTKSRDTVLVEKHTGKILKNSVEGFTVFHGDIKDPLNHMCSKNVLSLLREALLGYRQDGLQQRHVT